MDRRTFVNSAFAVVASNTSLLLNATPILHLEELTVPKYEPSSWITDKGDYYVVKIPDGKTFIKEVLDKPSIIVLGENSKLSDLTVHGYASLYSKHSLNLGYLTIDQNNYECSGRSLLHFQAPRVNCISKIKLIPRSINIEPFRFTDNISLKQI